MGFIRSNWGADGNQNVSENPLQTGHALEIPLPLFALHDLSNFIGPGVQPSMIGVFPKLLRYGL